MGRKVDIKVYLDNGEKLFLDKVKWDSIEPNIEKKNYDGSYSMKNGDLVVIIENYYAKGGETQSIKKLKDEIENHQWADLVEWEQNNFIVDKDGDDWYFEDKNDSTKTADGYYQDGASTKKELNKIILDYLKDVKENIKKQREEKADYERERLDGKVEYNPYDYDYEGNYRGRYFEEYAKGGSIEEMRDYIQDLAETTDGEGLRQIAMSLEVEYNYGDYDADDEDDQDELYDEVEKAIKEASKSQLEEAHSMLEEEYAKGGKLRKENEKKEKNFPQNPDDISGKELKEHFDLNNDGKVTIEEYAEHVKYHCKNPETLDDELEQAEYERGFKYKKGGKTKEAKTWKEKYNKKYGFELNKSHSLSEIAKKTGVSKKGIQKIYNKGIGAYKTNPQSVRPNVKSKEQWAYARVYSAVMGGNAAKVDAKELKMAKGGEIDIYNSLGWWLLNSPEGKKVLKKSKNIPEFKKNIKKELPISAPGIGPIKKVDKDFDWEYLWKYTKIYNKGGKIDNFEYYTDWDSFWEFYMESVKKDIGENKFKVSSSSRIAKSLSRIPDDFRRNTLNPLIRKAGMVSKKIALKYDPKATTFYSTYDRNRKQFVIGYPTFTQYMCYWEPAMKAAFRHEMGHILRGDCLLTFDFSKVKRANACMDIRINSQLNREAMEQVYKCLYFNNKAVPLLVPEQQFPKIGMPYDEENPIVPDWWIIADYFNRANDRERGAPQPQPEGKDKFEIGDYVIINKTSSEHNDKPGKVVDIDGDSYIIEEISQEEFEAVFEQMQKASEMMQFAAANFILGDFKQEELLPLNPKEEPSGDYGGDDDEEGGEAGDDSDGEAGEGGEPKTPEEKIEEAEKILNDLINAGITGEDDSEAVYDDELSPESKDKGEKEEKEEGEEEGKEEGAGDTESKKPTTEQEERLSDIEKKIKEVNLNNKIKQSLDNYQKIKAKHKDKMTTKEIAEIDKAIDKLEKIL